MNPWTMNGQAMANSQMGYPTLPNSYGIGSQVGAQTDSTGGGSFGLATTPQMQAGGQSQQIGGGPAGPTSMNAYGYQNGPVTQPPDQASALANPWNLTGEANAR